MGNRIFQTLFFLLFGVHILWGQAGFSAKILTLNSEEAWQGVYSGTLFVETGILHTGIFLDGVSPHGHRYTLEVQALFLNRDSVASIPTGKTAQFRVHADGVAEYLEVGSYLVPSGAHFPGGTLADANSGMAFPSPAPTEGTPIGSITIGSIQVTLHRIWTTNALTQDDVFAISPGNKAVFLDISLENTGKTKVPFPDIPFASNKAQLIDSHGASHSPNFDLAASHLMTSDAGYLEAEVEKLTHWEPGYPPGEKARSWVLAFEIPENTLPVRLVYTTIFKQGQAKPYVISINPGY